MDTEKNKKNFLSILFKIIYYLVISFVCLIVIFLIFYIVSSQIHANDENYKPNISIYTIVSPSMTPVIKVYDVVINVKVDDPTDIQVGDIITYKSAAANSEGMTITHRVVEISRLPNGTYEYMTQGDNNSEPDSLYVTYDNVIGKEILIIPYIGKLQLLIANQKGWLFLLLIPVSVYLIIEVIKLIDLFSLRKKVNRVVGTTEDNFIEKNRLNKLKEAERKEQLKEELENNVIRKIAKQKSSQEPEGFLEKYSETVVSVKENKYVNTIKPKKNIDLHEKDLSLTKSKSSITEPVEVLVTDELTSKIEEYNTKIEELDKMIQNIEKDKSGTKKDKELLEVDDYLKESKIKVISVEPAKSAGKKTSLKKEDNKISLKPDELSKNTRKKIKRPESEDIIEIRNKDLKEKESQKKTSTNKKETLNLNPKNVKKINRSNKKNQSKKVEVKVNISPDTIKKVERPTKKKIVSEPKVEEKKTSKKPLIIIEKTK